MMRKKIALVSVVVAIIGLTIDIIMARGVGGGLYINLMGVNIPDIIFRFSGLNYINVFFNMLLLTGGLLLLKNGKEKRLIRYVFSLILFSKVLWLLIIFIALIIEIFKGFDSQYIWFILLAVVAYFAWGALAYFILRYFQKEVPLEVVVKNDFDSLVEASKWKRVVNRLADFTIMVLLLFPYLKELVFSGFMRSFAREPGGEVVAQIILMLFIAFLQVLYYFIFELVFQATPGKMLTGTRVVTSDGGKPSVKQLFIRSTTRLVPFEAFSVFGNLWHDSWSDTYVVNEKREGASGAAYFLIFPIYAVLGGGIYAGLEAYRTMQYKKRNMEIFEHNKEELLSGLDKLTDKYFITLSEGFIEEQSFLKVEKIDGDSITFTYIDANDSFNNYSTDQCEVERFYSAKKDSLPQFTISKKQLKAAIDTEYKEDDIYSNNKGKLILNNGRNYVVSDISEWFGAALKLDAIDIYEREEGQNLSISVYNIGYPAVIEKVTDNTDSGINLEENYPIELSTSGSYGNLSFISGAGEDIEKVDLNVFVKDSANSIRIYNLKSDDPENEAGVLKRIK